MKPQNCPYRHLSTVPKKAGRWGDILGKLLASAKSGYLSAIIGNRGTGKTQLAVELCKMYAEMRLAARYTTAADFLAEIKATYAHRGETEIVAMRRHTDPDLLIVDEYEKRTATEWEGNTLFTLLDTRYRDKLDTLIISNLHGEDFVRLIGPSIASRIQETSPDGVYVANWQSYREKT